MGELKNRKAFWASLSEVPFVSACQDNLIKQKKEGSWIGICMSWFATGVQSVLEPATNKIAETFPNAVSSLDKSACQMLENAKDNHEFLHETPQEILSSIKSSTKTRVQKAFSTSVGMQVVKGLDCVITAAENVLDKLESAGLVSPEKSTPEEKHDDTEKSREPAKRTSRLQRLMGITKDTFKKTGHVLLVKPLEIWIRVLNSIRIYIGGRRLTPEKAREIKQRRKKSPKKRVHRSRFARSFYSLLRWCGLSSLTGQTDIRLYLSKKDNSPNKDGRQDKRKHDDMSESEESENLDQLQKVLDDYDSGEDPDYKPGEQPAEDSLEYQSGDTESDVEQEPQSSPSKFKHTEKELVQIKEKEESTKPASDESSEPLAKTEGELKEKQKDILGSVDANYVMIPES